MRVLVLAFSLTLGVVVPASAQVSIAFDKYHAFAELTAFMHEAVYRVRASVRNAGYIPTATEMMVRVRRATPVVATLAAKGEVEFIKGPAAQAVGHLDGAPAGSASVEWIVRVKGAAPIEAVVSASAPTAGRASRSVVLK